MSRINKKDVAHLFPKSLDILTPKELRLLRTYYKQCLSYYNKQLQYISMLDTKRRNHIHTELGYLNQQIQATQEIINKQEGNHE